MELKITLNLGVTPAFEALLERLLGGFGGGDTDTVGSELDRDASSQEAGEADAGPTKGKGGRKKKDTPTAAATDTTQSGAQPQADPLGIGGGQTATTGASTTDDAAMALLMGETDPPAPTATKEDVAGALRACMDKGIDMPTLQNVFVTKANGAKSVGQVDPSFYGAVKAEFDRLLAA